MKFIQTLHEANKMLNLVYKFKQVQIIWVPVLLHRVPTNFKIHRLRFFNGFKFVQFFGGRASGDRKSMCVNNYEIFDTSTAR